jgi:lysophospholipase L1-like esterase
MARRAVREYFGAMISSLRTRAARGALACAAAAILSALLVAPSAIAAPAVSGTGGNGRGWGHETYVALGDSYAAGQGATPYENQCLQSDASYPERLDELRRIELVVDGGCSGATTEDVQGQLAAVTRPKKVDLVTLTVGANDVNGPAVAAACSEAFESPECQAGLAAVYALLTPPAPDQPSELAARLTSTFTGVATLMPRATIVVTGYPNLFETPPESDPNYAIVAQLNSASGALNATISSVVTALAQSGLDIRYADVTALFTGHGIGSADPWINSEGIEAFHPTARGYLAYAKAVRAVL